MPYASPHITLAEWQSGQRSDIDVFEDQTRTWLFEQARALAPSQHSGPAILALVTPYFEAIACYLAGKSSKGSETAFLRRGIAEVFTSVSSAAIDQYVSEVRHGFAHESMFRRVLLHRANPGLPSLEMHQGILSVDPWWVLAQSERHFNGYVASLRAREPIPQYEAFESFMLIRKRR